MCVTNILGHKCNKSVNICFGTFEACTEVQLSDYNSTSDRQKLEWVVAYDTKRRARSYMNKFLPPSTFRGFSIPHLPHILAHESLLPPSRALLVPDHLQLTDTHPSERVPLGTENGHKLTRPYTIDEELRAGIFREDSDLADLYLSIIVQALQENPEGPDLIVFGKKLLDMYCEHKEHHKAFTVAYRTAYRQENPFINFRHNQHFTACWVKNGPRNRRRH